MANPPEPPSVDPTAAGAIPLPPDLDSDSVEELIVLLREPQYRNVALFLLAKKREEQLGDLALLLWNSTSTIYILLMEIIASFKLITSSMLTIQNSTRVCHSLVLLQCVASHPETRMPFIHAKIPLYLYPLLNTTTIETPFELLRVGSLAVIGGLLKVDDPKVVHFLLETGIFPMVLRCMELGCVQSKSVAALIVSKILLQEEGLKYCCDFAERVYTVVWVLGGVINCINLAEEPSLKLLNLVMNCYLRLSEMPRACDALRDRFPARLRDPTFIRVINEGDPITAMYLQHLLYNLKNLSTF
ncbi:hypothetical protein Vadar_032256 [Vaccinium darrowii]|uniref:Uncharacterized protein n=1 Tax=Vaccinium darrowii TaxID=229202 RepID=A0ACB7XWC4_9ERIC|nr:hypothetical protein Vadar_032256 [Vaccinium darrowii]